MKVQSYGEANSLTLETHGISVDACFLLFQRIKLYFVTHTCLVSCRFFEVLPVAFAK